jgi:hypothetical protein
MLVLSRILIANPHLTSFYDLLPLLRRLAEKGERFFQADIKPHFPDTRRNWESLLEAAFTRETR